MVQTSIVALTRALMHDIDDIECSVSTKYGSDTPRTAQSKEMSPNCARLLESIDHDGV